MCCVGSTQQQTPHEKAPQPPSDQNRVRRGDGARAMPGTRPDVGRRLTGGAAHHHVLYRQDHQVSAARSCLYTALAVCGFQVVFDTLSVYNPPEYIGQNGSNLN